MEQNMPVMAKKLWKMVRVAYFMLRKGISKGKILADLNFMLKRGKIAGKLEAIHNLMFHHHQHHRAASGAVDLRRLSFSTPLNEFEYKLSCSGAPAQHSTFHLPFHLNSRRHSKKAEEAIHGDLLAEALQMIDSAAASPALPGFGASPPVRQLRVTDSPFPLKDSDEDDHVDEAAEEFIAKFYHDLKQQNSTPYLGYY